MFPNPCSAATVPGKLPVPRLLVETAPLVYAWQQFIDVFSNVMSKLLALFMVTSLSMTGVKRI